MNLLYETYDDAGNIRLKNPISKTGYKIGDRIAKSPGNEHMEVHHFGEIMGGDGDLVIIQWDDGTESSTSPDFVQLLVYR